MNAMKPVTLVFLLVMALLVLGALVLTKPTSEAAKANHAREVAQANQRDADSFTENLRHFKDSRTGICYAIYGPVVSTSGQSFAAVDCNGIPPSLLTVAIAK